MKHQKRPYLDAYWKGMVNKIKSLPSQPDALVEVRWFWGREDIEGLIEGLQVDPKLGQ